MADNEEIVDGSQVVQGDLTVLGSINNAGIAAISTKIEKTMAAMQQVNGNMNNLILGLADDGIITISEKVTIKNTWEGIETEYPSVYARGVTVGMTEETLAVFSESFNALKVFLLEAPGILADMGTASEIAKADYRAAVDAYITARETVLGTIDVDTSNELILLGVNVTLSAYTIKRDRFQELNPDHIVIYAKLASGAPYLGRFKVELMIGSAWYSVYQSQVDEAEYYYTPPAVYDGQFVEAVHVALYQSGGTGGMIRDKTCTIEIAASTAVRYWGARADDPTSGMIRGDYYFDNRTPANGGGCLRFFTGASWIEYLPVLEGYAEAKATSLNDVIIWAGENKGLNNDIVSAANAIFGSFTAAAAYIAKLSASEVEILGTLRTGIGAAEDARIAIQDYSGCSRKKFIPYNTGAPGVDDLTIVSDSTVEGEFEVVIDSTAEENTIIGSVGPAGGRVVYVNTETGYALEAKVVRPSEPFPEAALYPYDYTTPIDMQASAGFWATAKIAARYIGGAVEYMAIFDSAVNIISPYNSTKIVPEGWIYESRSNDGVNWTSPRKIFEGCRPSLVQVDGSRVIVSCATEERRYKNPSQFVFVYRSNWTYWQKMTAMSHANFDRGYIRPDASNPGFHITTTLFFGPEKIYLAMIYNCINGEDEQHIVVFEGPGNVEDPQDTSTYWSFTFLDSVDTREYSHYDHNVKAYTLQGIYLTGGNLTLLVNGFTGWLKLERKPIVGNPGYYEWEEAQYIPGGFDATNSAGVSLSIKRDSFNKGYAVIVATSAAQSFGKYYSVSAGSLTVSLTLASYLPRYYDLTRGMFCLIDYQTEIIISSIYYNKLRITKVITIRKLSDAFLCPWSVYNKPTGATYTSIETGEANKQILSNHKDSVLVALYADEEYSGFHDWYVPSIDELQEIYNTTGATDYERAQNGFPNYRYWSSTEATRELAFSFTYALGQQAYPKMKWGALIVVRKFYARDRFKWKEIGDASYQAAQAIDPTLDYTLGSYGINISFLAALGHKTGDKWTFRQGAMKALSVRDINGNEYFYIADGEIHGVSAGILPIGFIYIQYPGKQEPGPAFGGVWTNISSSFPGAFFRAEGGNASAFGSGLQVDVVGPHTHTLSVTIVNAGAHQHEETLGAINLFGNAGISRTKGNYGGSSKGTCDLTNTAGDHGHSASGSALSNGGTENRPDNYTIRLWERKA